MQLLYPHNPGISLHIYTWISTASHHADRMGTNSIKMDAQHHSSTNQSHWQLNDSPIVIKEKEGSTQWWPSWRIVTARPLVTKVRDLSQTLQARRWLFRDSRCYYYEGGERERKRVGPEKRGGSRRDQGAWHCCLPLDHWSISWQLVYL